MSESALDIEAIKRRLANVPEFTGHPGWAESLRDVVALVAEVERLREELESLVERVEAAGWHHSETDAARELLVRGDKSA